jgi:autotransporter family porin
MKRSALILFAIPLLAAGTALAARLQPPHNRAAPKIAGAALNGQTLSARRGRWANRPTAFRYAWQSCDKAGRSCVRIRGAKRPTYRLGVRQVGHRLRVVVTAFNRAGHRSARSKPTGVVPVPISPPPPPPPPLPPPPPPPPGYFKTDPSRDCVDRAEASCSLPNSLPRTASFCASAIIRSSWEPRADNYTANHTFGDGSYVWGPAMTDPYWAAWAARVPLIQGQFTGTTTEMFSWAACRWGVDEDLLRAVAVIESTWHQSTWGDRCGGGDGTIGSFSVVQIKNKNCDGSLLWGGMPDIQQSTALAVDLYAARLRACYNGDFYEAGGSWLYGGQTVRQIAAAHGWPYVLWGCVGSWYSGSWYDAGAVTYIDHVQTALAQRVWLGY